MTSVAPVDSESVRVRALSTGGRHFCSASALHSPTRDLVITAAHCLSDTADISYSAYFDRAVADLYHRAVAGSSENAGKN